MTIEEAVAAEKRDPASLTETESLELKAWKANAETKGFFSVKAMYLAENESKDETDEKPVKKGKAK